MVGESEEGGVSVCILSEDKKQCKQGVGERENDELEGEFKRVLLPSVRKVRPSYTLAAESNVRGPVRFVKKWCGQCVPAVKSARV